MINDFSNVYYPNKKIMKINRQLSNGKNNLFQQKKLFQQDILRMCALTSMISNFQTL